MNVSQMLRDVSQLWAGLFEVVGIPYQEMALVEVVCIPD